MSLKNVSVAGSLHLLFKRIKTMNLRISVIVSMIVAAVITRLAMSGVPNVSPVTALALFSGALLADRKLALAIPLIVMFCSDLIIGLHNTLLFVYGAFVMVGLVGIALAGRLSGGVVMVASLFSSLVFFLVTNFGVWLIADYYPLTLEGLITCFVAALPFFHYSLLGDLLFTGILFGGYALLERHIPALHRPHKVSG